MISLLRQFLTLTFVGVVAFVLYVNRGDVLAHIAAWEKQQGQPRTAAVAANSADDVRTVHIRADRGGHFFVHAKVDGTAVRFMIDTGASAVVLSPEDAARVGLRPREPDFTLLFHTANGPVRAAPVTLREVRIGAGTVRDVDAVVNERPIGVSLLGISFLRRLGGYAVQDGVLTLTW